MDFYKQMVSRVEGRFLNDVKGAFYVNLNKTTHTPTAYDGDTALMNNDYKQMAFVPSCWHSVAPWSRHHRLRHGGIGHSDPVAGRPRAGTGGRDRRIGGDARDRPDRRTPAP